MIIFLGSDETGADSSIRTQVRQPSIFEMFKKKAVVSNPADMQAQHVQKRLHGVKIYTDDEINKGKPLQASFWKFWNISAEKFLFDGIPKNQIQSNFVFNIFVLHTLEPHYNTLL